MSGLRMDNVLQKNKSGTKMMNLRSDKLMISKQDTIEHI
jgi:hypothetical protein